MTKKMNKKTLGILSAAHWVTDLNQGALPALLPFFKETLQLSYTMAGTVLLFANLTSSIIQPLAGYFSDRKPIGWFLPLAPFIACLGMAAGMMVGFTVSAGGIGVTVLGAIADAWGVPMAMKAILILPLIAFGLSLIVKYPLTK